MIDVARNFSGIIKGTTGRRAARYQDYKHGSGRVRMASRFRHAINRYCAAHLATDNARHGADHFDFRSWMEYGERWRVGQPMTALWRTAADHPHVVRAWNIQCCGELSLGPAITLRGHDRRREFA